MKLRAGLASQTVVSGETANATREAVAMTNVRIFFMRC
jgi:hypothetical protein